MATITCPRCRTKNPGDRNNCQKCGINIRPIARLLFFVAQILVLVLLLALSLGGIAIMSLYVAIRLAGHAVTARTLGFSLQFRPWESGIILALGIAAAFGWFFPGGSFYLPKEKFRCNEACPAMGKIALAGIIPSLLLLGAFVIWSELSSSV